MPRSIALTHILRKENGIATGIWGPYRLRSAFQPIFAFRAGKLAIAAFEGLIRPVRDGQPQSPGSFFKATADTDRLAIETLTRTLHLLNSGVCFSEETSIFVNFDPSVYSSRSVADAALRDMRLVLHEARIDPYRVVCEVTEQRTDAPDALDALVGALRSAGFRIAVDDYGAEDSDIDRIAALKPDIVKFDAHWITELMASGLGFAMLRDMVAKFSDQGIVTVFEGIEASWQLDLAEKSGASMVQGYILARPELAPTQFAQPRGQKAVAQGPDCLQAERGESSALDPLPHRTVPSTVRPAKVFGRRATGP